MRNWTLVLAALLPLLSGCLQTHNGVRVYEPDNGYPQQTYQQQQYQPTINPTQAYFLGQAVQNLQQLANPYQGMQYQPAYQPTYQPVYYPPPSLPNTQTQTTRCHQDLMGDFVCTQSPYGF